MALFEFYGKHNRIPGVHDAADAEELVKIAEAINNAERIPERGIKLDAINPDLINPKTLER